ncbi:hypothetical protein BCR44DRAFT_34451 [Catenaria anguillulae PL171]|uniref:F-box domain-containing protein n=1 Tax=Catenaria anguillulae PL171 TaxID=765915 RepID=A0A1Y2I500_9FUNG|nr:hypothetical protein BCR44DRAFT_34451 [Catenaria anguillulae PL171]
METPVVPLALANAPIRRVEIYGLRSFIVQDWQHVFNHPTMHSLVLDFMLRTADLNQQPPTDLTAPALKSFTINCNLALDAFPRLDQPMYSALEELTLVHANWGFMSTTSDPTRWDQVPAIPFAHLPTLRKFSVLSKHLEQNVWINIRPEVLIGLLELPRLQHLSLPHVLPYFFLAPFAPALIRCDALHSLDVGTSLFCDMLSSVELPNLLSLMLRTTYIVEPDHQLSPKLWQRIHDRWGSQLVHFGYRCLSCELNPTPPCTFPPDFAFPKLRTIDIFKFVGTFDLSHISSFAPNLDRATINADHVSNLPALLTHPTLTHLQLAGPRCPTMLEALLTYPPLATLHLSLVPRATPGLLGRHSTAIGRECTRTSVTLTYDRERNGHVWQMLARSVHLGQFRHWINDAGGEHEDDVDEQNEWQATVVVPADLQLQEASWIESVVGGVLAEWKGVKVRVGVGQGEGGNVPEVAVMLIEVIKLQLRSAAASIEWVGQVEEPAAGGHKRVC